MYRIPNSQHIAWEYTAVSDVQAVASIVHGWMQAVKRLLRNAASRDVTLYEVPGGYHELFMGPEKDDIIAHINAWVLEHAELKAAHDQQQ